MLPANGWVEHRDTYANTDKIPASMTVCPSASKACVNACLRYSGRGNMGNVIDARLERTMLFIQHREEFYSRLNQELRKLDKRTPSDSITAIRLNIMSDINHWHYLKRYENITPSDYPRLSFYDYTKVWKHLENIGKNVHFTFSWSGENREKCLEALALGVNVAVPFDSGYALPAEFLGYPVIDGDEYDYRPLDKSGVIVGLKEKRTPGRKRLGNFIVTPSE